MTDPGGRVTGVALAAEADGEIVRREVTAARVFVAAGAIESARLLLNSPSAREPGGLGNNADQVGRHSRRTLRRRAGRPGRAGPGLRRPRPERVHHDFRHHQDGIVGGGMLANDFVPPPLLAWNVLAAQRVFPTWGLAGKQTMRTLYRRLVSVSGPIQEVPNPHARVTVDPRVRDRFGLPVARLPVGPHPEDRRTADFLGARAVDWLNASGERVLPFVGLPEGPSAGQHQAGTCRMGADPATSVTDPWGRVWGHDNLYVVDGSLHVTNGGVNPVLTILAMAYRVSRRVAQVAGR